jgi:hypothetical protein
VRASNSPSARRLPIRAGRVSEQRMISRLTRRKTREEEMQGRMSPFGSSFELGSRQTATNTVQLPSLSFPLSSFSDSFSLPSITLQPALNIGTPSDDPPPNPPNLESTPMAYVDGPTSPNGKRGGNRNTNRYSVTALYSMAAEQDVEVEDDLGRGVYSSHCRLRRTARW